MSKLEDDTLVATGTSRYNMAVLHLMSAARFSRQCHKVEETNRGHEFGPFYDEIVACSSAAVLLSVAALEANINELHADLRDRFPGLPSVDAAYLENVLLPNNRVEILEKYENLASKMNVQPLAHGHSPYQNAKTLIEVRNGLVHFRPGWHVDQVVSRLGRKLKSRFPLSPFVGATAPIFPMRCMTHGLTQWAVRTVLGFASAYSERTGLPNRFFQFRDRMHTGVIS